MGLIGLFVGLGMFCALLWYCAIYALPVFVGFSVGWWSLNHGAGAGCILVGLIAGISLYWLGRLAAVSSNVRLRWLVLAAFVVPAAYSGFSIVAEMLSSSSSLWRLLFGFLGGLCAGGTAYVRMVNTVQMSD